MANAVLEAMLGPSGLTLTVDLYPFGSDTAAATGITLTEATNRKGLYTGTTSAGLTGLHQAFLKSGSTVVGVFDVYMTNDTSVHRLVDQAASLVVQDATGAVPMGTAGGNGGLPTVDASNRVAGVVGLNPANLDATVSSRAPSSTALTNATWTDARAGKLDNLDAAVSSRGTGDATAANQTTINNNVLSRLATTSYTAPDNTTIAAAASSAASAATSAASAATNAANASSTASAIQMILSGITSLAKWLRALARNSSPDATALSEINVTGGTYSATADSLQAIAGATGGAASDPLANPLGNYGSNTAGGVLQNLGKVNVTIVSPITNTGLIKITQGDDYKAADNRAIPFPLPVAQWGDLTNATVAFVAVRAGSRIGPLAGTIVNGNASGQEAQVELAAADTSGARPSDNQNDTYEYAVRVVKAGDEITVFRGPLLLERNLFV